MDSDTVYERVREEIARGVLHPNERLIEADLTDRFDASRSSVRTALVRLGQEGLVEHVPNRGARVRLIGEAEAVEIYEARSALEALAAGKAASSATPADVDGLRGLLARIRSLLEEGELMAASDLNMELHAAVLRISGHVTAARLVAGLNPHLVRFHYRTILHPDRPARSYREHEAIVEAIARGDAAGAEAKMREHLLTVTATLRDPLPE